MPGMMMPAALTQELQTHTGAQGENIWRVSREKAKNLYHSEDFTEYTTYISHVAEEL